MGCDRNDIPWQFESIPPGPLPEIQDGIIFPPELLANFNLLAGFNPYAFLATVVSIVNNIVNATINGTAANIQVPIPAELTADSQTPPYAEGDEILVVPVINNIVNNEIQYIIPTQPPNAGYADLTVVTNVTFNCSTCSATVTTRTLRVPNNLGIILFDPSP